MSAETMKARRAVLRWLFMPTVLISLAAGLGSVMTAEAAADTAPLAMSSASSADSASPVTAYVANSDSGTVTPIATATNAAGPPILAGSSAYAITITPDGKTAYVADVFSDTVIPIATATNTAGPPITTGNGPIAIAITPDGKTAYVVNRYSGTVTPIATATNTAGPPITTGNDPIAIAITPDSKAAYVANEDSSAVSTVTQIATATNAAGPPITTGIEPYAIAITPDGKTAYVTNLGSGTVTPIATATNTAGPPITTGTDPEKIAITPDGKTAYVTNDLSGTVTPIATATDIAGPPITTGADPTAIAITPGTVTQGPTFTSSAATTAAYGVAFTFSVTATGDPAPRITRTGRLPSGVRFADNEDGTATISGTPAKAATGVYRVTLTARNRNGTATQAFTLTVTRAPAIRKIRKIRVSVGAALRLTVQTAGYPAPALAESGPLPGGLSFTDNGNGTAVIAGTPAASSGGGRYPVTITATNTSGTATRHFTIVVTQPRRG